MKIDYEEDCHYGTTKLTMYTHFIDTSVQITSDICYMHINVGGWDSWDMLLSRSMCEMIRSLLIRSREPPYKDEVPLYSASGFDDSVYFMSIETVKDLIPTMFGPLDGVKVGFSDRSPLLREKRECMICITDNDVKEIIGMLGMALGHQKRMKELWKTRGQLWKNRDGTVTERPKREIV